MKELMKNSKKLIEARNFLDVNYDEGIRILGDQYALLHHGEGIPWSEATGLNYKSISDYLRKEKKISLEALAMALIGSEFFLKNRNKK